MKDGDAVPVILTAHARLQDHEVLAEPTAIRPERLFVSHPVPRIRELPRALRAATVADMALGADRTNYLVSESEFPTYTVTDGMPSHPILWSMWVNDVLVVEDQEFATFTDSQGKWSGRGSLWTAGHVGFWRIVARTGGRQASIRFMVSADRGEAQPMTPQEMLGVLSAGVPKAVRAIRFPRGRLPSPDALCSVLCIR